MKNILFVIESLHFGGAEKSLVTLLNSLNLDQFRIDLMLFNRGGIFEKYVPDKVNIIDGQKIEIKLFDRIKYKLCRIFNLKKRHNAQILWKTVKNKYSYFPHKYDIAIAYNQGFASYYTEKYIQAGKKYLWLNTDYKNAGYNIVYDYPIYSDYSKIIAVSEEAKHSIESELRKIKKHLNIEIIKDITDYAIIKKQITEKPSYTFKENVINVVSVGRLAKHKGFSLAIESCKKLIEKGYKINWYIVGKGQERPYLEAMITQFELQDRLFLTGATDNPYPYINACDIYVQTSLFEGLGLTVIEAAYLDKPIVTTNFPSVYGIIEHEKTGLISEMNADSIATSVERLINDKSLVNSFVKNLNRQDKEKDKKNTLKQIYELFEIE